jgi:predicted GNAT family acetyltransferase
MWIGMARRTLKGPARWSAYLNARLAVIAAAVRSDFDGMPAALVAPTLDQILDFCAEDPVERVFLEDVARRGLGRFRGLAADGRLVALCHHGVNVVPSGHGCGAFAPFALDERTLMIIGEERAVSELWDGARRQAVQPRADRLGQPVFVTQDIPLPAETGLREASRDDLGLLLPACAAAHREELGVDPLAADADAFRLRTEEQIDRRRSWLWAEGGTILFKAEASAWTPRAVQLQQVWVDPDVRGRGYGKRGLAHLCRLLLTRVPTVCLFVRPENTAAIRLYEAIGMRRVLTYRSVLF